MSCSEQVYATSMAMLLTMVLSIYLFNFRPTLQVHTFYMLLISLQRYSLYITSTESSRIQINRVVVHLEWYTHFLLLHAVTYEAWISLKVWILDCVAAIFGNPDLLYVPPNVFCTSTISCGLTYTTNNWHCWAPQNVEGKLKHWKMSKQQWQLPSHSSPRCIICSRFISNKFSSAMFALR
jgi:hypothetical protein